jgi:hypothetical protein
MKINMNASYMTSISESEKVNYLAKFEPLISLFMVSLSTCLERNKRTTGSSKTHTHHYLIKVRQAHNHVLLQMQTI